MSFNETLKSLIEEKFVQDPNLNAESAFCEIIADYLEDSSLINEFTHSPYFKEESTGQNLKIDGFCINENETVLSMFIASYNNLDVDGKLNLKEVELFFKQLYRVLNYVIRVNNTDVPKAHVLSSLNKDYQAVFKNNIVKIDFYLFTNNTAVNKKEVDKSKILSKADMDSAIDYNFRIYDIKEVERLHKSNQKLDIDVEEYYDKPINVLKPDIGNSSYGTAIAIFPGKFLYNIYSDFGGRLLESNVRSFLSTRVKVNKGIKDTLINGPEMFLAYNNGLCVTVSEIVLNEDNSVKTFKNFQIVNGGQTTSSIFFATQDAKKTKLNVDLERVNVMAKITEIRRNIDSVKIQSTIAKNSNLQNAVKQSDLSSNEEYLINLHTCSKKFRNPTSNNYYYFERTRGQYQLEKNLSKNEKHFLNLFPNNQKLEKSDLSILFYCALSNKIEPFISVRSAEKRYNLIRDHFDSENKKISEEYFVNIIGSFIFYKLLQSKYGAGKNAIGRIRKNVIAYSISLIQEYLLKSNNSVDFQAIWSNDGLDIPETKIKEFLIYINQLLLQNLDDGRLDEACKKEESWNKILKKIDWSKLDTLIDLLPICEVKKFKKSSSSEFNLDSKYELMVDEINKVIYSPERYGILDKRIQTEIETYMGDGMSLYSRSHRRLMKDHFRPSSKLTDYNPKTYKLYLDECRNKNGEIIKKKFSDLKIYLDNLYRVFNAILQDELLELE
ncbi:AIPR family protein [Vicingus serpentipes]|uniref:AIPR family protein n=1 Tax=Vicingus serpentipes TaxID=1926625 RepID=A0A5C6RXT2_9FLAO|nr:AIPR family protein [Vicingus serpentipes]TXB66172.1 AIPR family protein [Vicingus serpentipes]